MVKCAVVEWHAIQAVFRESCFEPEKESQDDLRK